MSDGEWRHKVKLDKSEGWDEAPWKNRGVGKVHYKLTHPHPLPLSVIGDSSAAVPSSREVGVRVRSARGPKRQLG